MRTWGSAESFERQSMNRNAGSAQLVAAMADRIDIQRLVVVPMVVDLRGPTAVNARPISERRQQAGDYGAADFALAKGTTERGQPRTVPAPLCVISALFDLAAGRALYEFGRGSHLAPLRLAPENVRPKVFVFELAAGDSLDLECPLQRDLAPLRNRLMVNAQGGGQGIFAAEMADNVFEGLIHGR